MVHFERGINVRVHQWTQRQFTPMETYGVHSCDVTYIDPLWDAPGVELPS